MWRALLRSGAEDPTPPPGAPGDPSSLAGTAVTDHEVTLTWERDDDTDTAIVIERAADSGGSPSTYTAFADLEAHANIFTDYSPFPNTTYWYRPKAKNASGSSSYGSAVSVTTPIFLGTVTSVGVLTATVNSAWQITLTITNVAALQGSGAGWIFERSTNQLDYVPVALQDPVAVSATQTFVDGWPLAPLTPNTTYYYRARKCNLSAQNAYGEYTYAAAATTSTIGANPSVPTGLTIVVNSATSATISWTDTNSAAATYQVETASLPGDGFPASASFSQVTETAAGATSYGLTTVAKTPKFVRVRAKLSGNNSAYCAVGIVRPASTGTGGTTYEIGPGKAYTTIGGLNWGNVGPGDTINLYCKAANAPYYEKLALACRGTAASPIRFVGIPDGSGNLPIIDGQSATTNSQFALPNTVFEDLALICLCRLGSDPGGHQPGYLSIEHMHISHGSTDNSPATYTQASGATGTYLSGVAGIRFERCDHITLLDCEIHDNSNGIYGAWNYDSAGYLRALHDLTIEGNSFEGNGSPGSYLEHHAYFEAENVTYQYNRFKELRTGAVGGSLKDRGSGLVVRYNWFSGGTVRLDVVETQNSSQRTFVNPLYRKTYVYGNVFESTEVNIVTGLVNYGGDQSSDWSMRKGTMYWAYNTFVWRFASGGYVLLCRTKDDSGARAESFDVRNNVFMVRADSGSSPTIYVVNYYGRVYFGSNWISPGFTAVHVEGATGGYAGGSNLVSAVGNDPGFTDRTGGDYRPAGGSQLLNGATWALPGSFPSTVSREYVMHISSQARATTADLGYYEN